MGGVFALGQDASMHPWMQRLDASSQDLRSSCVFRHLGHRQAGLLKHLGRTAAGQQLIAVLTMQSLR